MNTGTIVGMIAGALLLMALAMPKANATETCWKKLAVKATEHPDIVVVVYQRGSLINGVYVVRDASAQNVSL